MEKKFIEALDIPEYLEFRKWALDFAYKAYDPHDKKGCFEQAENILNWLLCQENTEDKSKEIKHHNFSDRNYTYYLIHTNELSNLKEIDIKLCPVVSPIKIEWGEVNKDVFITDEMRKELLRANTMNARKPDFVEKTQDTICKLLKGYPISCLDSVLDGVKAKILSGTKI